MSTLPFRNDIRALRAIAIAAVMAYHLGLTTISGGYIGVDLFFVISGFLMTQIIVTRLEDGTFSYCRFIAQRMKRILPALLIMIAVLIGVGWFYLPPAGFSQLGKETLATTLFYSNHLFARKVDYFNPGDTLHWLLHIWSLSVECQFYLLYPLVVLVAYRINRRRGVLRALLAISMLSLLTCIMLTQEAPRTAFFGLPSRAWLFTLGGLAALAPLTLPRGSGLVGLALFVTCAVLFTSELRYPGIYSVVPALAGYILLASPLPAILTQLRVIGFLGDSSYSLYLWHWPVILALDYLAFYGPTRILLALVLSLSLASLSLYCVELPARRRGIRSPWRYILLALIGCGMLGGLGSMLRHKDGFPARVPAHAIEAYRASNDMHPKQAGCLYSGGGSMKPCMLGNVQSAPKALVWGDSHAAAAISGFESALSAKNRGGLVAAYSACPPVANWVPEASSITFGGWSVAACTDFNQQVLAFISAHPEIRDIYLVAAWSGYLNPKRFNVYEIDPVTRTTSYAADYADSLRRHLTPQICRLSHAGKRMHLVLPTPIMPSSPPAVVMKQAFLRQNMVSMSKSRADHEADTRPIRILFQDIANACNAQIHDPAHSLCNDQECPAIDAQGHLRYRDDNHLTTSGSRELSGSFTNK